MDIGKMKSNLKMRDLYFSECSVKRSCTVKDGEYKADLQRKICPVGEHQFDVELKLTVEKDDMAVSVVANAHFLYEADEYDMEEKIINANTVAIMFPFIRSQVTLLTTQPGMTPIVLPPINTASFLQ